MKVKYIGRYPAVDVIVETGEVHFEHGEPVDVPSELAESLLAQGDNFALADHGPTPAAPTALASLKVAELKQVAADRGVDVPTKATKADLLAALNDKES